MDFSKKLQGFMLSPRVQGVSLICIGIGMVLAGDLSVAAISVMAGAGLVGKAE